MVRDVVSLRRVDRDVSVSHCLCLWPSTAIFLKRPLPSIEPRNISTTGNALMCTVWIMGLAFGIFW